jgi:hypothetical protein
MRTMNCRSVRREIEEAGPGDLLSPSVAEHMRNCPECLRFSEEDVKLREIVSSLGVVEAPVDFEFRLRARLAGQKRGVANHFSLGSFAVGFRGAAFASLLLLFASALLLVSLKSQRETSISASDETPATTKPAADQQPDQPSVALAPNTMDSQATPVQKSSGERKPAVIASAGNTGRLKTRDMGSAPARVLRPSDLTARASDFPIEARSQGLKVSLDDGRGSSRTISLPAVSFGSERAVSQNTSPLVASARGSW